MTAWLCSFSSYCSSSWSLLSLQAGTTFVDVQEIADTILKTKLLLSILDCEANIGTVRIDDGFCGA